MSDKPSSKLSSSIASTLLGAILILLGILFLVGQYIGVLFDFDIGHFVAF